MNSHVLLRGIFLTMKIVYTGTNEKTIPGFNKILKRGVVISDEKLVESLKKRPDFQVVKENLDQTTSFKKRGNK